MGNLGLLIAAFIFWFLFLKPGKGGEKKDDKKDGGKKEGGKPPAKH